MRGWCSRVRSYQLDNQFCQKVNVSTTSLYSTMQLWTAKLLNTIFSLSGYQIWTAFGWLHNGGQIRNGIICDLLIETDTFTSCSILHFSIRGNVFWTVYVWLHSGGHVPNKVRKFHHLESEISIGVRIICLPVPQVSAFLLGISFSSNYEESCVHRKGWPLAFGQYYTGSPL